MDLKQGHEDVWDPYVANEDVEVAQKMWDKILSKTPIGIKTFSFFINEGNAFVREFIERNQGKYRGDELILELTKKK